MVEDQVPVVVVVIGEAERAALVALEKFRGLGHAEAPGIGSIICSMCMLGRHVAVVVPEANDGFIPGMLVAQYAERRGAQIEQPAVSRRQPEPASGQDPEEMAMTEEEHAAARAPAAGR